MTLFLDVAEVSALIKHKGVETFLSELAAYVAEDYGRWNEFTKMPRPTIYSPVGVNQLMPIGDKTLYAFKYVNDHPKNIDIGLMCVVAFGMLADVATGYPQLVSELTLMTAMRTGAISALAAKHLARKDSKTMAIIGNGSQSEFQAMAFKSLLGISEIRIYDRDHAAMEKFTRNLHKYVNSLKIVQAQSAHEAVAGVDIITTATADKVGAAILTADMIEPGMHINGIGGDCPGKTELHPEVLKMGRVFVEFEPQTRIEGDIQQMPDDFPVTELWRVFSGAEPGRLNDSEITIFDNVGFAVQDFSALRYLYDQTKAHKIGKKLNLVPDLADPKDLFTLIRDS